MSSPSAGDEIPEGMSPDARETWPSPELISSWLGDAEVDFEWRPGEASVVHADDPEAVARARRFRDVLGRFASGVTVVTAISGGEPVGMTCQSFSSVSLDPPLVLFVPAKTSRAFPLMQRAGTFAVNFLSADQAELSNTMASRGSDKFAGHPVDAVGGDGLAAARGDPRVRRLPDPRRPRGRRPLRRHRPGARPRGAATTSTRCCSSRAQYRTTEQA